MALAYDGAPDQLAPLEGTAFTELSWVRSSNPHRPGKKTLSGISIGETDCQNAIHELTMGTASLILSVSGLVFA